MTVVKFPQPERPLRRWQAARSAAGRWRVSPPRIASGEASGWEIGITETGDPQVYLLGPPPDYDCILSISRLGHRYVLGERERHAWCFEHRQPDAAGGAGHAVLSRRKAEIIARMAVVWCAIREAFEEKTEAMLAEPIELLTHVAPQLAALA